MIKYTELKETYFKTQQQYEEYIGNLRASENMPNDIHMGLKLNGYAVEKHKGGEQPSYTTHVVTMMPQLSIGAPKGEPETN